VARKVEQKVAKLGGGRPRRAAPRPATPVPPPPPARSSEPSDTPAPPGSRKTTVIMTVLLSIAMGFAVASATGIEEAGAAAGMMTVGMMLGLSLARRAVRWFGVPYGKNLSSRVIHAGCCAPFLGIGGIPLFESPEPWKSGTGVAIWLGLMLVAMFADWRRHFERKLFGSVSFGSALWVGFGAIVATAIASAICEIDPDEFVLLSAAVAGMVALIAQSTGIGTAALAGVPASGTASAPAPSGAHPQPDMALSGPPYAAPADQPGTQPSDTSGAAANTAPERWAFTRAFWGILTFLLVGGTILLILLAAIARMDCYDDKTGVILGSIACGTFMLFTIRKTTPTKNVGFWREWLRPLLITVSLFGIGGTITGIVRYGHSHRVDEIEFAMLVTGLVMSSLMLLIVSVLRGKRRRRQPTQFLTAGAEVPVNQGNDLDCEC